MDALPSGSYLVLSHPASDIHANQAEVQRRYNERVATPQTLRSHAQVCRFFDGLQLVPPGWCTCTRGAPTPTTSRRPRWSRRTAAWRASPDPGRRQCASFG